MRPSGDAGTIDPSKSYRLRAKHSGRLLSISGGQAFQQENDPTVTQVWTLAPAGGGQYRITSSNGVLTANGVDNDTRVVVASASDSDNQLWRVEHIVGSWFRVHHVPSALSKLRIGVGS